MQQDAVLKILRGNDLKLSGDGRCDSSGYSAKYCTYSLTTDLILDYKLIQSSETGRSVAIKKEGLRRSLNYLDVSIVTIATDRHQGVGALMKSDYPYINHQYNVWHMAKSVVKQLTQKGKLNTVNGFYHGSIQFPITYGGLRRHVMEMYMKSGHP